MKQHIFTIIILSLVAYQGYAQVPVRQTSDLEPDMQNVFSDKRKMGNVEIVKTSTGKTIRSTNLRIKQLRDRYCNVDNNGRITDIKPLKIKFEDKSLFISFPGIPKDKVGKIMWPRQKKMLKFNPKQDNIENFRINMENPNGLKISVLKDNEKRMAPEQFGLFPVSKHFHFPKGVSGIQQIVHSYSPFDYLEGRIPFGGMFMLAHQKSGEYVEIPFLVSFSNRIEWIGRDGVFVVRFLKKVNGKRFCHVRELRSGHSQIVTLPFVINACGEKGADGKDGIDGIDGMDAVTVVNKDGSTTTIKGICGTRGFNAESGEDGGNGGNVLVILDNRMKKTDVSIITDGGKGGRGGRGGKGGKHGNGSGCFGSAPNGSDGADGHDGNAGEQEIIRTETTVVDPVFDGQYSVSYKTLSLTLY